MWGVICGGWRIGSDWVGVGAGGRGSMRDFENRGRDGTLMFRVMFCREVCNVIDEW